MTNGEGKTIVDVTLRLTIEHVDGPYRPDDAVAQAAAETIAGEWLDVSDGERRSRYLVDAAEVSG